MTEPTITDTAYREGGANRIIGYVRYKEEKTQMKDHVGRDMSKEELKDFVERTEEHQFHRHISISPANAENLENGDLERATRNTVDEFFDSDSVSYCYGIHDETGNRKHAHVILAGSKDDLYMNPQHCDELREIAHEQCKSQERSLEQELMRENGLEQKQEREREQEISRSRRRRR